MHTSILISLAVSLLSFNAVAAGPCKASTSDSVVTSETSSLTSSTTDTTTTETPTADTSTTETTTTSSAAPIPTVFNLVAQNGPAAHLSILSDGNPYNGIFFTTPIPGLSAHIVSFSISNTGRLLVDNSRSVCAFYTPDDPAVSLIVCPDTLPTVGVAALEPITCEVSATGKLLCSAPAKTCSINGSSISCTLLPGTVATLYSLAYSSLTWNLVIGSENLNDNGLEPVTVSVKAVATGA
ncbi:hypothetical protein QQX98_004716 [Neonectria punicea]|uniref:Uncharacterized protein n=1 Tax=Neonectria punicea TaxID=979145 RepID=A0ABR1H853_9HYPO